MRLFKQHRHGPVHVFLLGYSPVGPPIMSVYFYYLDGLLIDTGQSHMRRQALDAVGELPIHAILLTHHHEDHSGNAAAFHHKTGAPVLGQALTATKLKKGYRILPYQHLIWGRTAPVPVAPLSGPVESGRYTLTPVATPGHSRDHTVFLEKNRGWLFSGDLFIGEKIKFFRVDENFDDQLRSLDRVLGLDFDTLFCAHNPRLEHGKRHLRRKRDYLLALREAIWDLHGRGYPVGEIVKRLGANADRRVRWITLGNASFAHMVRSALDSAHPETASFGPGSAAGGKRPRMWPNPPLADKRRSRSLKSSP